MSARRWQRLARGVRTEHLQRWWSWVHTGDRVLRGGLERVVIDRLYANRREHDALLWSETFLARLVDGRIVPSHQLRYDPSYLPGTSNGMAHAPPGPGDPLYREGYGFPPLTVRTVEG